MSEPFRRRTTTLALTVAVVGLGTLFLLGATVGRHGIERTLESDTRRTLEGSGFEHADVEFTGRDGRVTVHLPGQADAAAAIASSVPGVRTVTVMTGISAPAAGATAGGSLPSPLLLELSADTIRVRGSVPSDAAVTALSKALASPDRIVYVTDVSVDEALVPNTDVSKGWLNRLRTLIAAVPDRVDLDLDFTTGILAVNGTVATEKEHRAIMEAAAPLVPTTAEAADGILIERQ